MDSEIEKRLESKIDLLATEFRSFKARVENGNGRNGNGNGNGSVRKFLTDWGPIGLALLAGIAAFYDVKQDTRDNRKDIQSTDRRVTAHHEAVAPHSGTVMVREGFIEIRTKMDALAEGQRDLRTKLEALEKKIP